MKKDYYVTVSVQSTVQPKHIISANDVLIVYDTEAEAQKKIKVLKEFNIAYQHFVGDFVEV